MAPELDLGSTDFEGRAVSPFHEMGAYEALWSEQETTFKSLSEGGIHDGRLHRPHDGRARALPAHAVTGAEHDGGSPGYPYNRDSPHPTAE